VPVVIVVIGEILFDVFPDYKRLGGAPFNFAFHLHQSGLPVRFFTRIGDDEDGREIMDFLHRWKFPTGDIQLDPRRPTGRVEVTLDDRGAPEFDILRNVAYDAIEWTPALTRALAEPAEMIYFGTLVQRAQSSAAVVQRMLREADAHTRRFCDINLRPDCYTKNSVRQSLQGADILKLSDAEIEVLQSLITGASETDAFVEGLRDRFSLKTVCLTKGERGSELHTPHGVFRAGMTASPRVKDTVGAGDAYAAVLAIGILQGWPPERILEAATAFAAGICEIEGAIPASSSFYESLKQRLRRGGRP
jgi:fructokinase